MLEVVKISNKDFDPEQPLIRTNPEPFFEYMEKGWEKFLKTYRTRVKEFYNKFYESNPKKFLFMEPQYTVFMYKNREIIAYSYSNDADEHAHKVHQFETVDELREFNRLPPFIKKEKINQLIGRDEEPTETITFKYGFVAPAVILDEDYRTENPEDLIRMGEIEGRKYADTHGEEAKKEEEERFNIFGFEKIVREVNDQSFGYELGESIAAYKQGLYLAAAATAGIALENILRLIIIKKMGKQKLPDKTYVWLSIKTLDKINVLPGRLRGEVLSLTEVRNSNAHTNDDPVKKENVEMLFRVIKDLSVFLI